MLLPSGLCNAPNANTLFVAVRFVVLIVVTLAMPAVIVPGVLILP